jgi:protocatechuate 3,4-dioxygenase alpha subunit
MRPAGQTPFQTVGPYYSMRLSGPGQNVVAAKEVANRVRIEGCVLDGDGKPIEDALLETWQANEKGRYRHPADDRAEVPLAAGFTGFGRAGVTPATGEFWFETIKPGRVPAPDGSLQAPHICVVVQGRGMLAATFTRLYFPDEASANEQDFVLSQVPAARRPTLVAVTVPGRSPPAYRFDIRFQGPRETVFFDF